MIYKGLIYSSILLTFSFFLSCSEKEDSIQALQKEVIVIHDEVMPKMDQIMKLQKEIKSVKSDTTKPLPSDELILANNLITNLNKADEGMMIWMRNYDTTLEGKSEEEKIEYLRKQKVSIQQVKQEMLSSISEAKTFLENQ